MVSLSAFRISSSGMSAERMRLDVIASNIANADATRSADGGPYQRRVVQFASVYDPSAWQVSGTSPTTLSAQSALSSGTAFGAVSTEGGFGSTIQNASAAVRVVGVSRDTSPARLVYEPGHPDADAQGYVHEPNVEVVTEMTDMLAATRAYEANATAFGAAKDMFLKGIAIGS